MVYEQHLVERGLPPKGELEILFGHIDLEDSDDPISILIDHISDYLDKYSSFLENLLQPDSSLVAMKESSVIDDATRAEVYSLFKQLTYYRRESLKVALAPSEDNRLEYLKRLICFWKEVNPQLQQYVDRILSVWKLQESEEPSQAYFG
ncbi:MAG: hypothetical protein ACQESE_00445 [Nanobdellota archaeon]